MLSYNMHCLYYAYRTMLKWMVLAVAEFRTLIWIISMVKLYLRKIMMKTMSQQKKVVIMGQFVNSLCLNIYHYCWHCGATAILCPRCWHCDYCHNVCGWVCGYVSTIKQKPLITMTWIETGNSFTPKPMVPMECRDSEGVPFASLESLWPGIWQI